MNTTTFLRSLSGGVGILVLALLVVASAAGQNLVVSSGGSFSGTGTVRVRGNINTSGATAGVSIPGTVQLTSVGTPQNIGVAGQPLTFQYLQALGTTDKTMTVGVTVTDTFTVNNGLGHVFDVGALLLTLGGPSRLTSGTLNVSNTASEVAYNQTTGTQTVLGLAYAGRLTLTNGAAKNFGGTASVAGAFAHSGGNLTVDQNVAFSATGGAVTIATLADITAGRILTIGSATANINAITNNHGMMTAVARGGAINVTNGVTNTDSIDVGAGGFTVGGTLTNAAAGVVRMNNGALAVTGAATNDGTLNLGSAAGNFNAGLTNQGAGVITGGSGAVTVAGAFAGSGTSTTTAGTGGMGFGNTVTLNGGTLTAGTGAAIALNGNFAMSAGTMSLTNTGSLTVGADFASTGGTVSFAQASSVSYTLAGAQNVYNTTYGNLTIAGSGVKTALGDLTVHGTTTGLTLNNDLALGTHTLMIDSANTAVNGTNEADGRVRRNHTFTGGASYAFNRTAVTMSLVSTAPAVDITLGMFPNTDPTTGIGTHYVKRQYTLASAFSTAANNLTVQLYYPNVELVSVPNEAKLGLYKYSGGAWSKLSTNAGAYTRNVAGDPNTIRLSNVNEGLGSIAEIGMRPLDYITIATGGWNIASTWGSTVDDIPGATDDATVRHHVTGLNGANRQVANLTIQGSGPNTGQLDVDANAFTAASITSDGTITVAPAAGLTVTGALANNAGGTSAVTVSGTATLEGTVTNAGAFTANGATAVVNVAAAFTNSGTLTVNNAGGQVTVTGFDLTNTGSITNNGTITVQ